jgi:putative membrane protein
MGDWFTHENLKMAVVIETILYASIGLSFFGIAIWLMSALSPFSIRKEIEEDQNVALGIIMGSVIIGISIILSSILK